MKKKITAIILAVCILAVGFGAGFLTKGLCDNKDDGIDKTALAMFDSLKDMDDTVYVIGHQSPDSDTVISAIVMADLLNKIGVKAEARVAGELNNESKAILSYFGCEAPKLLENAAGKNLFLVDHNALTQTVDGGDEAYIVGIVDHHAIDGVKTANTVFSKTAFIGSTAFLIYSLYKDLNLPVDKTTAGLMIAAEQSDTNNQRYKDAITEADLAFMDELLEISGVDRDDLNVKRLQAKVNYEGKSAHDLLFLDYKTYDIGDKKVGIGTLNSIGKEDSDARIAQMKQALKDYYEESGMDYLYLMIHDYVTDEQYILCEGDGAKEFCEQALDTEFTDYLTLKESISRKSTFVPALTEAAKGQ